MSQAFGHTNSSVLDGGLPRWEADGLPLDSSPSAEPSATTYATPELDESVVKSGYLHRNF